jgi:hypothetical protein
LSTTQNYFGFKDRTYLQKSGLALGAPISSILSEIYLQYLENTKVYDILCNLRVEGYFRYADDVLIVYNENSTNIENILESFNNITPSLHFTIERQKDKKLNFLDLTIERATEKLSFSINRKPTTSDSIIPNDPCHPPEQKNWLQSGTL